MTSDRKEFLRNILPDEVTDIEFAIINLDITDLGICDIIRNVRNTYPAGSRFRNKIISGTAVVAVLCRSNTLDPLNGVFVLIGSDLLDVNIVSTKYLILNIKESTMRSDSKITEMMESFTSYLVRNYSEYISTIGDFYRKYIYDESELVKFDNSDDEEE